MPLFLVMSWSQVIVTETKQSLSFWAQHVDSGKDECRWICVAQIASYIYTFSLSLHMVIKLNDCIQSFDSAWKVWVEHRDQIHVHFNILYLGCWSFFMTCSRSMVFYTFLLHLKFHFLRTQKPHTSTTIPFIRDTDLIKWEPSAVPKKS